MSPHSKRRMLIDKYKSEVAVLQKEGVETQLIRNQILTDLHARGFSYNTRKDYLAAVFSGS